MKVAITGANGFIAKETISLFIQHDVDFIALTRKNTFKQEYYVETDYSVEGLSLIFKDVQAVVHLAAIRVQDNLLGYEGFRGNEIITENILKAMAKVGVNKIIYMSSISVYSTLDLLPWNEKQIPYPISFYGLSKLVGEQLCLLYKKKNVESIIFRCAHVLGYEDNGYMLSIFLRLASLGKTLTVKGKSIASREFVYVKDVARAILWAIKNSDCTGIYNLGLGKSYTNLEIAKIVNEVFSNVGNIEYLDKQEEGIESSYMDVSSLTSKGFHAVYSIESAFRDIKMEAFNKNGM